MPITLTATAVSSRVKIAEFMAKSQISRCLIARVLNHADSSVTGGYDRYEYLAEKRHALKKWGEHLDGLINPSPSNIFKFISAAG
jgi:hypothetical protein